jgi:hypothetical protein
MLLRLSGATRRLLVRTYGVVVLMRLALWTLPYPRASRLAGRLGSRSTRANGPLSAGAVDGRAQLVRTAARLVPRASCLTQAMALQVLLGRSGTPSTLRLGVARSEDKRFEAHAWLECDGRVVIGGGQLDRYVPLPETGRLTG